VYNVQPKVFVCNNNINCLCVSCVGPSAASALCGPLCCGPLLYRRHPLAAFRSSLLAALCCPLCCGPLLDRRHPLAAFRSSFCLRHSFSACRPPPPLRCSRTWYQPGRAPNPPGLVSTTTWITIISTLPWFSLTFTAQLNRGAGQQW